MKTPMTNSEVENFLKETNRLSENPNASPFQLRKCAQLHAALAEHHTLCVQNLIDNAEEAQDNVRQGEERRERLLQQRGLNPPQGEE